MKKGRTYGQDIMRGEWRSTTIRNKGTSNTERERERETGMKDKAMHGGLDNASGKYDYIQNRANDDGSGTSIFDPVLCELTYRWFSPPAGIVLDPFAGGSVRGIVASKLGREYIGVELRKEQVEANEKQGETLCPERRPVWKCGDSARIDEIVGPCEADLIFSCPPYADLEVYSDDPADISNMPYEKFIEVYRQIISKSVAMLKEDRFAVFVVGEVREKKGGGYYRGFVPDTIRAFQDAGARFYNEAILVTAVGSLPIRTGRMFEAARKMGKTHQNYLVFCKGDPKKATEACGKVEVTEALSLHTSATQESLSSPLASAADQESND